MLLAALALPLMIQSTPYEEPLRPQFHFTAKAGWLNDPNGLAFFGGEYHLFFQHNPFGTQWGNMTWGHAVSPDLVHWRQIDHAIEPDRLGTIFSGSAVVDVANTSGLGTVGKPALVCIYTAAGGTNEASKGQPFTQCLASSTDGRIFAKLPDNPVLGHLEAENRDPKVLWHEPTGKWVMALFLDGNRYALLGSKDLRAWTRLSTVEMPGASECPDFFELPVVGDRGRMKWVFWGGSGRYRVGSFDGTTFTPETESIPTNFGNTGYAAQTYFNDPNGRRVQIAWHNNANFPGTAWNQELGIPTELTLVSTPDGPRLRIHPVSELARLHGPLVKEQGSGWFPVESGLIDATVSLEVPPTGTLALVANGQRITYDAPSHDLKCLDRSVRVAPVEGRLRLRVLVDRASLEIFAQEGAVSMPIFALPVDGPRGLRVERTGAWTGEVKVYPLNSAWPAHGGAR
ncbi:MAG: glycoside hydrolase family 32 protein [Chthonomonadaceae bacterium]|nr:glycoside hydrolase family 32 protein [Chthonomonadaceae bacterium]